MKPNPQAAKGGTHWPPESITQIETAVRNGATFNQIRNLFPSRTDEAVRHRIRQAYRTIDAANAQINPQPQPSAYTPQLMVTRPRPQQAPTVALAQASSDQYAKARTAWTQDELQTLATAVQSGASFAHIRALFPDRSAKGVRRRYERSAAEEGAFSTLTAARMSRSKSRSRAAPWTAEEEKKIRDALRSGVDRDGIAKMFPARSGDAVRKKMSRVMAAGASLGGDEQDRDDGDGDGDEMDEDDDGDMDLYEGPSEPEEVVERGYPGSHLHQPPRARAEFDYAIGPIFEDEESRMSGALPVLPPGANANEAQERGTSHGAYLFSDHPDPDPEAPFYTEHTPHSYVPYPHPSWDIHSTLHPATRAAWLNETSLPAQETETETPSPSAPSQKRYAHPTFPKGSFDEDHVGLPVVPYPFDLGRRTYQLAVGDHPDLRDGLEFAPVPHHPWEPVGFVTSEEMLADDSVLPSVGMGEMLEHDGQWEGYGDWEDFLV